MKDKIDELAAYYDTHDTTAELEQATPREPVPADEVMIVTSLRLPKPVMDEVRERARARGIKPTALIREWIEAALAEREAVVPISVIMAAVMEYQHRRAS
ncbi:CopG family antitoxin [Sphaerisporangium sp. B11E5]|uniref:CopG family antitoxin n=1 Tax=Sphaerisporangium sp. B11E5 TaxID=3153563 RepID=UPI00325D68AA